MKIFTYYIINNITISTYEAYMYGLLNYYSRIDISRLMVDQTFIIHRTIERLL